MMVSCTNRPALTAVLMLFTVGACGIRVWKEGPQVGPDGRRYKVAGFRRKNWGQSPAVSVHCTEDTMVVIARADLYGTGRLVTASELRLGPDVSERNCRPVQREDTELVITAGLHECGAEMRVEDDSLVYANTLFHTPVLNRYGIIRSSGVAIPLECRYKRIHFVSSNSQPAFENSNYVCATPTTPVMSPPSGTDDWMSERSLHMFQSDEVISMVASVLSAHHNTLKLFLDRCVATLGPNSAPTPTCDLINFKGCQSPVSFLPWADGHVLSVKLNLPRLLGDNQQPDHTVFITCWMKSVDLVQEKNKVCSYMGNSWCSVDGKHKVCECCDGKCDYTSI